MQQDKTEFVEDFNNINLKSNYLKYSRQNFTYGCNEWLKVWYKTHVVTQIPISIEKLRKIS